MSLAERGTGRTSRQLAELPDGGVFLVPTLGLADHCRSLLRRAGRSPNAVHFVTPRCLTRVIGFAPDTPWAADHSVIEVAGPAGTEAIKHLTERFSRA